MKNVRVKKEVCHIFVVRLLKVDIHFETSKNRNAYKQIGTEGVFDNCHAVLALGLNIECHLNQLSLGSAVTNDMK